MGEMLMIMAIIVALGTCFLAVMILTVGRQDPLIGQFLEGTFLADLGLEPTSHDDKVDRWNTIAERLGVERVDNYPQTRLRIAGTLEGVDLEIRRAASRNDHTVTLYEIDVSEVVPPGFELERQNPIEFASELGAGQLGVGEREDIYVGEERLDREFTFRGQNEQQVKEFVWQPGVEEKVAGLVDLPDSMTIRDGVLKVVQRGGVPPVERAVEIVRAGVELVEAAREDDGPPSSEADSGPGGWEAPA